MTNVSWREKVVEIVDSQLDWDDANIRYSISQIEGCKSRTVSLSLRDGLEFQGTELIRQNKEIRKKLAAEVLDRDNEYFREFIHWEGQKTSTSEQCRYLLWYHGLPENLLVRDPSEGRKPSYEVLERPVPMPPLRDYQEEMSSCIQSHLESEEPGFLLPMPTGSGKTRVALEGLMGWMEKQASPQTIWWFASKKELCRQAAESASVIWKDLGLRGSDSRHQLRLIRHWDGKGRLSLPKQTNGFHHLVVSTFNMIEEASEGSASHDWLRQASVLVFDEAHERLNGQRNITASSNAVSKMALTATPYRDDPSRTSTLISMYPKQVLPIATLGLKNLRDLEPLLTKLGYLSKIEERSVDVYGMLENAGMESKYSEEAGWESPGHMRAVRDTILGLLDEGRESILVFVKGINESNLISLATNRALREAGIQLEARSIHSGMGRAERAEALQRFRDGRISCLINPEMLTAGFDAPRTDCVVIAKNVNDHSIRLQMIGRGLRGPESEGTESCLIVTLEP